MHQVWGWATAAALCFGAALGGASLESNAAEKEAQKPAVLNFTMKSLTGKEVDLAQYQGKTILIVNVASECGLTPQYKELEALYEKYQGQGFVVLGFPSNDFGKQEPGTDAQIADFCRENYGVKFPMFSKVVVKGEGQCPLYRFLTSKETNPKFAGDIKWNFEKFLVGRDGQVIARFAPSTEPSSEEVVSAIEKAVAEK